MRGTALELKKEHDYTVPASEKITVKEEKLAAMNGNWSWGEEDHACMRIYRTD